VTLLTFAAEYRVAVRHAAAVPSSCHDRSISPDHWADSSKPAAEECGGRMMGQTDGWTPTPPHTM